MNYATTFRKVLEANLLRKQKFK